MTYVELSSNQDTGHAMRCSCAKCKAPSFSKCQKTQRTKHFIVSEKEFFIGIETLLGNVLTDLVRELG